jgi:hypothetical protein
MINPSKASYSMAPTIVACAAAGSDRALVHGNAAPSHVVDDPARPVVGRADATR